MSTSLQSNPNPPVLDINKIKHLLPAKVFAELPVVRDKFEINTPARMAHFLGNASHESANFTRVVENLNYTTASRLVTIFPKYFPSITIANKYVGNPKAIANRVYASRMGNGDEASGDGWKHRGMGYLQTTGKSNQVAFGLEMGFDANLTPDLIANKYPLVSAAYFFKENGLLPLCDKGTGMATITIVRKRVNGGSIGLSEVAHLVTKFNLALTT